MGIKLGANVVMPEVKVVPGMLAYVKPLEDTFRDLRSWGYKGIEFITTFPEAIDVPSLKSLMAKYDVEPVGINTGRMCGELGLSLSAYDRELRSAAIDRVKEAIRFAGNWGIPLNIGIIHGNLSAKAKGERNSDVNARCVDSLQKLCRFAQGYGVELMVESVMGITDYLNTLEEASAFCREVDEKNMKLMYDFFQLDMSEKDMAVSIRKYFSDCIHLHFADTDRKVPGDGSIDWKLIFSILRELGYNGTGSIEIAPLPTQEEATRRAAEYLLPFCQW